MITKSECDSAEAIEVVIIIAESSDTPRVNISVRLPLEYYRALEVLRLKGITHQYAIENGLRLFLEQLRDRWKK